MGVRNKREKLIGLFNVQITVQLEINRTYTVVTHQSLYKKIH